MNAIGDALRNEERLVATLADPATIKEAENSRLVAKEATNGIVAELPPLGEVADPQMRFLGGGDRYSQARSFRACWLHGPDGSDGTVKPQQGPDSG
jgi:hypothetical protein